MSMSQLHRYSVGLAAENKPLDSRMLNITPVEVMPALDGEINFNPEDNIHKGVDANGEVYEVKATTDITLTAEWLPLGSNRVTPPDIRRGELIEIYRVGDSDQYFWRCMGLRDDLRRLETAIFAFNGSPDEGAKGIDATTCYFFEVSTHKKMVTMSTSQANGEPFGYSFQVNAGDGQVTLEDTIGNTLFLDSGKIFWELINADGTYVQLDRRDIHAYAPQDITLKADRDIDMYAGNEIRAEGKNRVFLKCGSSTIEMTPGNITEKSPRIDLNP